MEPTALTANKAEQPKEVEPKTATYISYNPEPLRNRTRTIFAFSMLGIWAGTLLIMLFHANDTNYDRYKDAFSAVSVIFSALIGYYFGKKD